MDVQQLPETTSTSAATFNPDVTTSTPLDLSFKQNSPTFSLPTTTRDCPSSPSTIPGPQSLNELLNLQKRFIDSTTPQNYADQLQKVTNGPTGLTGGVGSSEGMLPPSATVSSGMNPFPGLASLASSNWPMDWNSMCKNIPLPYQLAAYSLWSSNFAAALSSGQSVNPLGSGEAPCLIPSNSLFPFPLSGGSQFPVAAVGGAGSPRLNKDSSVNDSRKGSSNGLFKRSSLISKSTKYSGTRLPAATPPEALGISMRGNQKYSAYYQRPFHAAFGTPNSNGSKNSDNYSPKKSSSSSASNLLPSSNETTLSKEKEKGTTRARETAFVCSCGEEFENLYIFTLHMKDSDHCPRSNQTYQDIPKLVRGQDMWINSETEQTREILRCMHCRQSFQTLPDLTMHMIKTNHYSEIVYSDSGRCVFVNPDNNIPTKSSIDKEKEKLPTTTTSDSTNERKHKTSASSPKLDERKQLLDNNFSSSRYPKCSTESCAPPKKRAKLLSNLSMLENQTKLSPSQTPEPVPPTLKKTEVTEADSATVDSEAECDSVDSPSSNHLFISTKLDPSEESFQPVSSDSVIRQIESFMEKNLPKTSTKIHSASKGSRDIDCNKHSPTYRLLGRQKTGKKKSDFSASIPYVAPPDTNDNPSENPLSSLQKLVETTHKNETQISSSPLTVKTLSSGFSMGSNELGKLNKSTNSCSTSSSSHVMPSSPTVIMVNPTYIYQPAFAPLAHLYPPPYPWYSGLNPFGLNKKEEINDHASDNKSPHTAEEVDVINSPKTSAVDLTKTTSSSCSQDNAPTGDESDFVEVSNHTNSTTDDVSLFTSRRSANPELLTAAPISVNSCGSSGPGAIIKKAKCNYCGKPFANKGQVRLHISKGKCPSLLQSCHSTTMSSMSTMAGGGPHHLPGLLPPSPFPYLPLDYVQRLAALGAANDATNTAALNEQLQMYYSLTKQLSSK